MHISILTISVVIIVVSVYWATIGGNIIHMENGRDPETGVTVIQYVIVPVLFYGVSLVGKYLFGEYGWCVIFILFFVFLLHTAIYLPKEVKKYKELLEEHEKKLTSCSN